MSEFDPHEVVFDGKLLRDWLAHPVTKVLLLVVAAEAVRQVVIAHGAKMLGLAGNAPGEV